jgi:hypothetical protein
MIPWEGGGLLSTPTSLLNAPKDFKIFYSWTQTEQQQELSVG